jgi:murein DD-endopeptidase MepM/ murein hydrolase activator NlpD
MLLLLAVMAATLDAPAAVAQGETLRVQVHGATPGARLRFEDRAIPIFADLGLIPIPVALKPGRHRIELIDTTGQTGASRDVEILDAHFPIQNIRVTKEVEGLRPLPGEMEAVHAFQERVSNVRWWEEPFRTPTAGCMSSPFGVARYHNGKPTGNYHKGTDIRAPEGQPIRAIAGGEVQIATMYRLHGGTVGVDHGQGVSSMYIHMSKIAVQPGDKVAAGGIIGYIGHTGFATGPHLHWGLYVNGLPVNARQWIKGVTPCGK